MTEGIHRLRRRNYTVVLDTFDGEQYGILPLSVLAWDEDDARYHAVKQATDDGWQKVKVMFVL
jgi:hypothetical protein